MTYVRQQYPKAGFLSGMAITGIASVAAIAIGVAAPDAFLLEAPDRLLDLFSISIGLLALHKVESFITGELDQCPVYVTAIRSKWLSMSSRAIFVTFASTLLTMLLVAQLAMRGAPWVLLLLMVWNVHAIHELHHAAKSLARWRYYPGTSTAIAFVAFTDIILFPDWHALLRLTNDAWFYGFYAAQPIALIAFYLEDRVWFTAALSVDDLEREALRTRSQSKNGTAALRRAG